MARSITMDTRRANGWRVARWVAAALLLLVPLVAMQVTKEVRWTLGDFVVFGAMLAMACGAYEIAARVSVNFRYRIAAAVALLTGFVLVWVNLAVGIVGSERNPANVIFYGVPIVAVIGAGLVRGAASGMSRVMVATAVAQLLAAMIAGSVRLWGPTAPFIALWLVSAWLFRSSEHRRTI